MKVKSDTFTAILSFLTQPSADSLKDKKKDEEFLISASMSYVFIVSFTSPSALNRHLDRRISHFNIPNE